MLRLIVIAALCTTTVSVATADDYTRAGTEGTVTAYELDGRTVIDNKICFRSGRSSYNYLSCMGRLRDTVKYQVCRGGRSGMHHYLYQHGSGRLNRTSVYCASRRY